MEDLKVTPSTGNVFKDLVFFEAEAMEFKAALASKITIALQHKRLSQAMAAELLGIDQPKISALMRGKLSGFSIERLFRFLMILGKDVSIFIKPKARNRSHGILKFQSLRA